MTQTIGNTFAAEHLFNHLKGDPYDRFGDYKRAPKGFRRLGAGVSRVAYLHKAENVVYKIGSPWTNETEHKNSKALRRRVKTMSRLPFTLYVPQTAIYSMPARPGYTQDKVLAMEYASGAKPTFCDSVVWQWMKKEYLPCTCKRTPCFGETLRAITAWSGLFDIHANNILFNPDAQQFWFIDVAD